MQFVRRHFPIALIVISGFILRIAAINDPISYDEAYTYVAFASRSLWTVLSDYSLPNNHIFHSLLVFFSTRIFGADLWAVRLPALLAGLGMILAAYWLGKKAYGPESGLLAAVLVAFHPQIVRYSSDARGYSLLGLFTLLALGIALNASRENRIRDWALLTLATAFGFWTLPLMLFPAGGIYLWLMLEALVSRKYNRDFFIRFFASGISAGVLTLAFYSPVISVMGFQRIVGNGFVKPVEPARYFSEALWIYLSNTWQTWTTDVPAGLVWLLILGFALSLVLHRRIQSALMPVPLAFGVWITLYILLRRPEAYDRFWFFLLAPLLLWAGAGLVETAKQFEGGKLSLGKWLGLAATLGLFALAIVTIPSISERWQKISNAQAAAQTLSETLIPGDLVLVGYPNDAPLWYYLGLYGVPEKYWRPGTGFSQAYLLLAGNQQKQTLEGIIRAYKLDPADFDLEHAELLGRFGQIIVYKSLPAR